MTLEDEVKAIPKETRTALPKDMALPIKIPTEHSLALKATTTVSWNKLRTLTR